MRVIQERRRLGVLISFIAAGWIGGAARAADPLPMEKLAQHKEEVPDESSPSRGKGGAKVTIVEFGDFACPGSQKIEATLRKVIEKKNVRLVFKQNPMPTHEWAKPAAIASTWS